MIRWTGLAPWEFRFPFPGSLTSTFLVRGVAPALLTRISRRGYSSRNSFAKSRTNCEREKERERGRERRMEREREREREGERERERKRECSAPPPRQPTP